MFERASFVAGIQVAWDATSISAYQKCQQYYKYSLIDGWRSKGDSVHLRFGGLYATALEHYFKHLALGIEPGEALYLVVKEALEETWERPVCETCSGNGCPVCKDDEGNLLLEGKPWTPLHDSKTRPNLIRTIIWYIDHFEHDETSVVHLADGTPAVELSFSMPVENDIIFAGHLDRLVEYGGDQYVMDQKTTGTTINKKFFDQFSPNTQMSMYTFAGQVIYNLPVKGVIIDAAQIAVNWTNFERGFTFRTSGQLEEWYGQTLDWIKEAQDVTASGKFKQNPHSCNDYGGCPFRHVCSRSAEVREPFLKADFEKTTGWDPLVKRV